VVEHLGLAQPQHDEWLYRSPTWPKTGRPIVGMTLVVGADFYGNWLEMRETLHLTSNDLMAECLILRDFAYEQQLQNKPLYTNDKLKGLVDLAIVGNLALPRMVSKTCRVQTLRPAF
jgi:hypothetical protein